MAVGSCTSCEMIEPDSGPLVVARSEFANVLAQIQNVSATANDTPLPPVTRSEATGATGLERPLQIG